MKDSYLQTKKFHKNLHIFLHKNVRFTIFLTFFLTIVSSNMYWGIVASAFQDNKLNVFPLKRGGPGFGPAIGKKMPSHLSIF